LTADTTGVVIERQWDTSGGRQAQIGIACLHSTQYTPVSTHTFSSNTCNTTDNNAPVKLPLAKG